VSAALLGALGARQSAPVESAAPPALVQDNVPAAGPPPAPVVTAEPAPDATSFLAAPPAAPKVFRAPAAAPASRRAPVEPPASRGATSVIPVALPPAASPPSTKGECDPPFYFEGTKKVFKPSCI